MTDVFTAEKRSDVMSRIRNKDTAPELAVRSLLHRLGYRFRLHSASLAGHPDIVLPRHRTVIFVHGCYWHRHRGCRYAYTPKSRVEFWEAKFEANRQRDKVVTRELRRLGWRVLVVWECQLTNSAELSNRLDEALREADVENTRKP
ncbi:MAG: DNA mismatch endonuclease Vsr [Ignavibacteria bacterium]|nr:DNA mismatch endonuclease Vsr [Ignavibacteria bacterium]